MTDATRKLATIVALDVAVENRTTLFQRAEHSDLYRQVIAQAKSAP